MSGELDFKKYKITIETEQTEEFLISLRIPDWIMSAAKAYVNEELAVQTDKTDEFVTIARAWNPGDKIVLIFPIGVRFVPLPDDETTGAFRYGMETLAGITAQERILHIKSDDPTDELSADTERQWGDFRTFYRTENQDPGISFCRLNRAYLLISNTVTSFTLVPVGPVFIRPPASSSAI